MQMSCEDSLQIIRGSFLEIHYCWRFCLGEKEKKRLTSKCTFGYEINSNLSNIDSPVDLHIIFRGDVGFSKQFHCTGSASETHNLKK